MEDGATLKKEQQDSESITKQLQERRKTMEDRIVEQEHKLKEKEMINEECVKSICEDNLILEKQTQEKQDKMNEICENTKQLRDVSASGMERKMAFREKCIKTIKTKNLIRASHQILYTVAGGTALITFEKQEVAYYIIGKNHTIPIGDCQINVKAKALELLVLDFLSLDMSMCSRKILVSNLPSMAEDNLMDKLELFFSKGRNGGGEVEGREFLADSKSVILKFFEDEVVKRLTKKKVFEVPFGEFSHQVTVTTCINGSIKKIEMRKLVCNRTVLITDIPNITDKENLQDMLEIHFQKGSNGGGEVKALHYCPEGHHTIAVLEDVHDD
ncbi:interferon-induced 35 kDa protein [Spea bombifrons]|uniref:interferon-induced 35 kDa protein n=1 Tax=Spea bombifrons TaxID=233779 RepID=UPI00234A6DEA|nr:interferon-induced 35 kDa protein [Spea bombifrons]